MHIHKINPNSQEHQSFLAQNRKDPITGDSILEGDEVVFCASCKSVFLHDTWEYLGKRHCEQYDTLIEFPSPIKLDLSIKNDIFFYYYLSDKEDRFIHSLPSSLWKKSSRKLSEYHQFFNIHIYFVAAFFSIIAVIITYAFKIWFVAIVGFLLFFVAILINNMHNDINAKNLKTIHKNFDGTVFFLSDLGVGFSRRYGIEEYILDFKHIKSLEFNFPTSFFSFSTCTINYEIDTKTEFSLEDFFRNHRSEEFMKALEKVSKLASVPILLKVSSDSRYNFATDFVNSNKSNIDIVYYL